MISKWYELKDKAIKLRQEGNSLKEIERKLGIARSTLSGWMKDIVLTHKQRKILEYRSREGLKLARKKAAITHHAGKIERMKAAENAAEKVISTLNFSDKNLIELSLAMLYWGEGFKKTPTTGMGNSDPLLLSFFLKALEMLYGLERENLNVSLHLRYDQNQEEMKNFWSHQLKIPKSNITHVSIDERTKGRATYKTYKGVCLINCGNVAIQRKLVYLSRKFAEGITNRHA